VSAVGLKLITFQCFDNFLIFFFWGGAIFVQFQPLLEHCVKREREMNLFRFIGNFLAFNFMLADCDISSKNKTVPILRAMANLVNFNRHLTSIKD
jgi:hypothetical protein